MQTYIAMVKWTPQGVKEVKQSASRLDAARKAYKAVGVTLKEFYMVMGHYDSIAILEAPDDAAVAKAVLGSAALGYITTETCRVFTEDEYRKIIGGLA